MILTIILYHKEKLKHNETNTFFSKLCLCAFSIACLLNSCGSKRQNQPPIDLSSHSSAIQVPFDDKNNNQIWVKAELNGVPIMMLYDTGFNGMVSMSLLELQSLAKNGQFFESDIIGTSYSSIADGSIVENGIVLLRSVKLTDGVELNNVRASISLNQAAPVLLGLEFSNQVASKIEVDRANKTLNITPW